MQVRDLTDKNLLKNTKALVQKEKEILALVIDHLTEIERRKLYSDLKYSSLFQYCIKELGYTEDQAQRRINALYLSKRVPKVKEKIKEGTLSLTNANLFSSFQKDIKLTPREENKLLDKISGASKKKCQDIMHEIREEKGMGEKDKRAMVKNANSESVRLSVNLPKAIMDKVREIQKLQKLSLEQALIVAISDKHAELVQAQRVKHEPKRKSKNEVKSAGKGRYIPKPVRAHVLARADYACENCKSKHDLQFEHLRPYARGGKSSAQNLKILCRNCNLRSGIKVFGTQKMQRNQS